VNIIIIPARKIPFPNEYGKILLESSQNGRYETNTETEYRYHPSLEDSDLDHENRRHYRNHPSMDDSDPVREYRFRLSLDDFKYMYHAGLEDSKNEQENTLYLRSIDGFTSSSSSSSWSIGLGFLF
jgi:hypothetical protein